MLLSPWFRGPEWRTLRLLTCIATGMFAFAPIGHAWYLWGLDHLIHIGVPEYLLEGVLLLTGCYIYQVGRFPSLSCMIFPKALQARIPESLAPGRFDIWGSSHTLWHIFVVLSIFAHMQGLGKAKDYIDYQGYCETLA